MAILTVGLKRRRSQDPLSPDKKKRSSTKAPSRQGNKGSRRASTLTRSPPKLVSSSSNPMDPGDQPFVSTETAPSPTPQTISDQVNVVYRCCGLVIEVKKGKAGANAQPQGSLRESLAQTIMYTLTLQEQCGTWLGMAMTNQTFCRLIVIELERWAVATGECSIQSIPTARPVLTIVIETAGPLMGSTMSLDQALSTRTAADQADSRMSMPLPFPHTLQRQEGLELEPDEELQHHAGLQVFFETIRTAYAVMADQKLDAPLRKLRPSGPTWDGTRMQLERVWDQMLANPAVLVSYGCSCRVHDMANHPWYRTFKRPPTRRYLVHILMLSKSHRNHLPPLHPSRTPYPKEPPSRTSLARPLGLSSRQIETSWQQPPGARDDLRPSGRFIKLVGTRKAR